MLNKNRVICISTSDSLNIKNIGGLESFYRRFAQDVISDGYVFTLLLYGEYSSVETIEVNYGNFIKIVYVDTYKEAIDYIKEEGDIVIDNYIDRADRFKYFLDMLKLGKCKKFLRIYFGRLSYIQQIEMKLRVLLSSSFSAFSVSRLANLDHMNVIFPPLPKVNKLVKIKENETKMIASFLGRFDKNKGVYDFIDVAKSFIKNESITFELHGYFAHGVIDKDDFIKKCNEYDIKVVESSHSSWSLNSDDYVQKILSHSDLIILPYRNLLGTMDPPYLILESVQSQCACITTPVGSVEEYYGKSRFVISRDDFIQNATSLISEILVDQEVLKNEKNRAYLHLKNIESEYKSSQDIVNYGY